MKKFVFALLTLCVLALPSVSSAQILDDDMPSNSGNASTTNNTDNDEALFNELFSDYSETDRDITKVKNFDDAIEQTANIIQKTTPDAVEQPSVEEKKLPPIEGELFIGVTNGSFRITKNAVGQPTCTFSVTLKSTLNRNIKNIALNLVYPYRTFAFIFKNIPEKGSQEKFIRTAGDICYNLVGVPDISINRCRIWATDSKECALRMKWDEKMTAPEKSENNKSSAFMY